MDNTYSLLENITMEQLLKESADFSLPTPWSDVSWIVIAKNKSQVLVDIWWATVWVIAWRELNDSFWTAKHLKVWDKIRVIVLEDENEDGTLVLSIRKAWQLNTWERFKDAMDKKSIVTVVPNEANKWWLLVDLDWIKAFIPVSQLAPEHYPRVENSDSNKILVKLKKIIWKPLEVCVLNVDQITWKMILSEKEARKWDYDKSLEWLKPWDVIEWRVTWVSKFGFFVTFNELEWLVHISEIAWGHVSNPSQYAKVWDILKVKVIWIEWNKISLSLKRMQDDPWLQLAKKYKVWDAIKWKINKVSEFWAFVALENDINWLIHLTEIEEWATDARKYFSVWQEIEAKVIEVNPDEHRIALSVKWLMNFDKAAKSEKPKKSSKEDEVKEKSEWKDKWESEEKPAKPKTKAKAEK